MFAPSVETAVETGRGFSGVFLGVATLGFGVAAGTAAGFVATEGAVEGGAVDKGVFEGGVVEGGVVGGGVVGRVESTSDGGRVVRGVACPDVVGGTA